VWWPPTTDAGGWAGLVLWNLLTEPKKLALYDGVGHFPRAELRIPATREFLDRNLE
jgi:hypothetical protein